MKKNHELKGSCACGNVKYKVEGNPLLLKPVIVKTANYLQDHHL